MDHGDGLSAGLAAVVSVPDQASHRLAHDIAALANQSTRPGPALAKALELVCLATGMPIGHALLRTLTDGAFRSSGQWYPAELPTSSSFLEFQRASQALGFDPAVGLVARVFAANAPVHMNEFERCVDCPRRVLARAAGVRTAVAIPVWAGDQIVAILELFAPTSVPIAPALFATLAEVGTELGRVFARSARYAVLAAVGRHVRALLDTCPEAFIESDQDDRIVEWSRPAEQMFGWAREEVLGRTVTETIVPPRHRDAHRDGIRRLIATGIPRVFGKQLDVAGLRRNGTEFPLELTLWSSRDTGVWSFCALLRDITQRKAVEEALTRRADYDLLTGLPNRSRAVRWLTEILGSASAGSAGPALLYIDLDHFKRINDSIGHAAGDEVLTVASKRLRDAVRPTDFVARLAGDEFLIVCPGAGDCVSASAVAERILASLGNPVHIGNDNIFLTASIGVVLANGVSAVDELIGAADLAMCRAKRAGGGDYEWFDQRIRLAAAARLQIESELRTALTDGELCLYYQPLVRARDGSVGAIEALMRWQHPNRGLLLPGEFIPVAEETGLIVAMGEWALAEACRAAEEWSRVHLSDQPIRLSVNLSARQLAQSDLVPSIERILHGAKIDPRRVRLGVEVTETMAMRDMEASTRVLRGLDELGIPLSIDDFGVGYSSLAYLDRLPADTLKIDISFVRRVVEDPVSQAIVRSVVDLGHTLHMSVVAEGVETEAQSDILRELGVDLFQGYLYARALPRCKIARFVTSRGAVSG